MQTFLNDVRQALRSMRLRGATTALAVLTFGLGIAASTAMFSVLDSVLLRPLAYPDPHELVSVYTRNPQFEGHPTLGFGADRGSFSSPEFRAVRESADGVLDGVALLSSSGALIYGAGEPELIPLGITTADLFARVLRVPPVVGRVFDDEDERTAADVIVLTEGFWHRRFGGDTDVIGTALRLGDEPYEIIGVVPNEAALAGIDVEGWVLSGADENWGNHWTSGIARLTDGMSITRASSLLSASLANALPADHAPHGVNLFARHADETRTASGPIWLLAVASLVLLAVACGNVAVLLVGAAIDREQELAVRAALGAGRGRLVRQLLTESALLGLGAAALGILLAGVATRALTMIAPGDVPRIADAAVDGRALAFGIAVALGCSLLFGLLPALKFSRTDLRRSISLSTRGSTMRNFGMQGGVIVGELALATVLLVGAGLLARTVLALNAVDPGFAANETLAVRIAASLSRVAPEADTDSARTAAVAALYDRVRSELAVVPGVAGVTITSNLPLSPDRSNNDVHLEGYEDDILAERRFVSSNYFEVMGIDIVDGRAFTAEDEQLQGVGVSIISEGLARRAYPDGSAVGRRLRYWGERETVIVGVAADIHDEEVQSGTTFAFYAPRGQAGQAGGTFVIRAARDPLSLTQAVRERVRSVNDAIAIVSVQPLSELLADQIASQRYRARLVGVFALLAVLFSLMGIYGVTSRGVAARTRELGIRMALGANPRGVLGLVLRQALRLGATGALVGLVISLVATRSLEAYLWGVARTDLLTLGGIAVTLGMASVAAALVPAGRAARVDPQIALRAEQ